MDETQVDSNTLFYGNQAATSGNAEDISAEDLALLEKSNNAGVTVQDGDQMIEVETGKEDAEDAPEETEEETEEEKAAREQKEAEQKQKPLDAQITEAQTELDEIGKDLVQKGVDVDSILEAIGSTGKPTDEQFEALEKAGYSKAAVNAIIKGQVALAQEATRAMYDAVGGEKQFDALSKFAMATDKAAVAAFNSAFERGDVATAQVILKGIERAHRAQYGTANKMLSGKPVGATQSAPKGYATRAEMVAAMSDNRYGKDMGYTREVETRTALATF